MYLLRIHLYWCVHLLWHFRLAVSQLYRRLSRQGVELFQRDLSLNGRAVDLASDPVIRVQHIAYQLAYHFIQPGAPGPPGIRPQSGGRGQGDRKGRKVRPYHIRRCDLPICGGTTSNRPQGEPRGIFPGAGWVCRYTGL